MDRSLRCLCSFEEMARIVVSRAVTEAVTSGTSEPVLVDATAGNGHDTLFLARLARTIRGEVLAFDIQQEALDATQGLLTAESLAARLVCASHARLLEYVSGNVAAVMFNLGFWPGSDKTVVTRAEHTLAALRVAADVLLAHGVISVHAYTGHPGGLEEAESVRAWARSLPRKHWRVQEITEANRGDLAKRAETLWLVEKVA